ncbi:MAG: lysophospholipid acyltransferase family protein [Candidatus Margulisbacteria bacterium]|nr:lysophospholipid acyltransferase family protein [Candidatus Margulisiibacteriota bacterium]
MILLKLLRFKLRLIFWLPAPLAVYLMRFAAELVYQIARLTPARNMVAQNYEMFFPGIDGKAKADLLLRNISYSILELLSLPFFKAEHFDRVVKVEGLENIDLALAKRNGGLFLTMHTGNYEIVPAYLSSLGYNVTSIVKAPNDPLFKLINEARTAHGTRLINVLDSNMYLESIKILSDNQIVGLLLDTGANEGRHDELEFLGRKMPVATGWLTLAQRSKAEIVMCLSRRVGNKVVINFQSPFHLDREKKEEALGRIRNYFETFVKNHPEQWGIFLFKDEIHGLAHRDKA